MDWKWLLLAIFFETLLKDITCKEVIAQVNPKRLIQYVPERFLSMTIDPGTILIAGNLGNEALNMARSLSPSFVRLGGKSTNYIQFGKELLMENTTITEEQWDSVYKFVSKAGLDLIASINPSNRVNGVWDSRDALQLISYSDKQGYNLAWQLGYDTEGVSASGAEIGRDIVRLRKILDGFSKFAHSPLFGPDLQEIDTTKDSLFVHDLLYQAGPVLGAIFLQPKFKPEEDPGQSIMDAIVSLDSHVWGRALRLGRILPRKPIWIVEREMSQGTSEDAIHLVKRLGSAARIGVQVVMRQVGPEALTQPTPEFWVSLIYKNLVGRGVLDARISSGNRSEVPIFSHCAQALPSDRSVIDAGMAYDKGAVTVFGVNESPEDVKISLRVGMKDEKVHLYTLTFSDNPNGKIEDTYMNGQALTLSPSGELPLLSPRVVRRPGREGIHVPGKSVFFMVLPEVKSRMCTSMPLVHAGEVKDLSKKLMQVAAEVLEKPHRTIDDEDEDKNKIYVKFGKGSNKRSTTDLTEFTPSLLSKKSVSGASTGSLSTPIISDKVSAPEDETTAPIILDTTTIPMDNCTVDTSEIVTPQPLVVGESGRRKRSIDEGSVVDMDFASSNHGQASQEELVKQFNSYASKVYESSKSGGDIQITNIPEEIFNTLKRVKVTFKNLGTTSKPEKLLQEVTEKPPKSEPSNNDNYESSINERKSESRDVNLETELGLDDAKQPDVYNDAKQEDIQRVPKQAAFTEDSKDSQETGESNFRDSQNNNDGPESEGEKTGEEAEPRSEAELAAVPAGVGQSESSQRLPRDDSLRQGESSSEPSPDEGSTADEATRNPELGAENTATDEPAKDEGDAEQSKSPIPANSLSAVGTTDSSQPSAQNDKHPTEEKETLDEAKTENYAQTQSTSSDINDKVDQKVLTTTEIPDVITIEGIAPKKVDELLLKIAKSDVNSSDDLQNVEKSMKITSLEKTSNKEANKGQTSSLEQKEAVESEQSSPLDTPTDASSQSADQLIEEGTNRDVGKSETARQEEVLENGPEIPNVASADTVKVVREILPEDESDSGDDNDVTEKPLSLVLEPSMNLSDGPVNPDDEPGSSEYPKKQIPEDRKEEIVDNSNSIKEQDASLTEDQVAASEEDLIQDPVDKPSEKSDDESEVKQLPVASFRDVPLSEAEDKSYTPKPEESKTEASEVEDLLGTDNKELEETETVGQQSSEDIRSKTEIDPIKASNISRLEKEVPDDREQVPTIPFQPLIVPFARQVATEPSLQAPGSDVKLEEEDVEPIKEDKDTDVEIIQNEKKENESKQSNLKSTIEKEERRLKLLAIRNQIMEARERFKAAAREEGWRAALQRRDEEVRNLLHQERDKRKFIALPVGGPERTLLSRPRRLIYDSSSREVSREDLYDDYGRERAYNKFDDVYRLPVMEDYNKPYLPDQVLPIAYNKPDPNHIIFPLDPKAPQAVVYNNRIIPAKLYGVISVKDDASRLATGPPKQLDPAYSKYINTPPTKGKYETLISEAPSLRPIGNYPIPRDSRIKRLDNQPNFIPVVVLSNTLRKKRALPQVEQLVKKPTVEQVKVVDVKKNKTSRRKRSLSPEVESYNYLNEIPKEKSLHGQVVSNEIKPEPFRAPPGVVFFDYPQEITGDLWSPGKIGEPRTIGGLPPLPPLPPPIPLLPSLHPVLPPLEPLPPPQDKTLPEPPQEKNISEPPQAIFFTMLQDKFKSLLGMLEGMADWCGVNSRK